MLWGDRHELRRALADARAQLAGLEAQLADRARTGLLTLEAFCGDAEAVLEHAARAAARPAEGGVDPFRSQAHVIEALATALVERDRYTGEHSAVVVDMARTVADGLGLDEVEVERVGHAALLHDIGKVAMPDRILHKPGPLRGEEWELVREHPVVGERILRAIPGLGCVARIVRHEHERFDGSGYPDGLAGQAIPLGSPTTTRSPSWCAARARSSTRGSSRRSWATSTRGRRGVLPNSSHRCISQHTPHGVLGGVAKRARSVPDHRGGRGRARPDRRRTDDPSGCA